MAGLDAALIWRLDCSRSSASWTDASRSPNDQGLVLESARLAYGHGKDVGLLSNMSLVHSIGGQQWP